MNVHNAVMMCSLAMSFVAFAQPVVGGAVRVTPMANEGQKQVRAAAGTNGFLAVWEAGVGSRSSIRAARVGLDGVTQDPSGITLVSEVGGQFEPAVCFGHGIYFVVWSDMRGGDHVLYGSRVSEEGQLLDAPPIALSTETGAARMADVAATPSGFVVVWAQYEPASRGYTPRLRRLGANGVPIAAPTNLNPVSPWTSGEDFIHSALYWPQCQHPRVAVQGGVAMVMWVGGVGRSQGYQLVKAFIDVTDGAQLRPLSLAAPSQQSRLYRAVVAPFGQGFLSSWSDLRGRGTLGLAIDNAALVATDGGTTFIPLQSTHEAREVLAPSVASNGVVAFVNPVLNVQKGNVQEFHLVVRTVLPDGNSPGNDVVPETQAAWPFVAVHPAGATLLFYTRINTAQDNGALMCRTVTP